MTSSDLKKRYCPRDEILRGSELARISYMILGE